MAIRAQARQTGGLVVLIPLGQVGPFSTSSKISHSTPWSVRSGRTAADLAQTRGLCALQLHRPEEAEQAARTSLTLINRSFVRNQAFSTLLLGGAYLADGDVDQAAKVIADGAALATRNRSVRLLSTLSRAWSDLRPWQGRPAVRELEDRLAAYRLLPNSTT